MLNNFIFFILFSTQVSAQKVPFISKNDLLKDGIQGTVKSKSEYSDGKLTRITKYNKKGFITSLDQYCTTKKAQTVCGGYKCLYDAKGNKIRTIDETFIQEFKYDSRDSLIEDILRSAQIGGKIKTNVKYTYNSNGKLASQYQATFQYNSEKIDFVNIIRYTYDKGDKLLSYIATLKRGGKPQTTITSYYYDDKSNIIKKLDSDESGQIGLTALYNYDVSNRLIERNEAYSKTSTNKYFFHETLRYDENGNIIERINYNKDGSTLFKHISQFDHNNKLVGELHYKGVEKTAETKYTYNDFHLLTTEEQFYNGKQHSIEKYLHDEKGNLISLKTVDGNGKPVLNISYKFEYY